MEQSKTAQLQTQNAEKGNINDRYIKAIDQLGATHGGDGKPNIEIRLGGIYGLEQVAKESDDLYPQIIEVLTAYVRANAVNTEIVTQDIDPDTNQPIVIPHKPLIEVQALITVLGRINRKGTRYDLSGDSVFLNKYRFDGDYSDANFSRTHCEGANFSQVH